MAELSRMAGAMILKLDEQYFLIGDLKEPCRFEERGFEAPGERDVLKEPSILLETNGKPVVLDDDYHLFFQSNKDDLPEQMVDMFMIFRNGSISERLWGLVTETSEKEGKVVNAQWLVDTPPDVWEIVRDSVLRC